VKDPPRKGRPTTGAQHDLEHLVIFLATGMAFGFGYPDRFRLPTIIAQPTFAAAIEVAQIWAPGRHARMSDFLVDAAASCLEVGLWYPFVRIKAGVTGRKRQAIGSPSRGLRPLRRDRSRPFRCRLGGQGEKAEPPTEENALTLAKRRAITGIIPLITT